MKKARLFLFMVFMFFALFTMKVHAEQWDYLPGGSNYLNEDIFEINGEWYASTHPFVIKPDQDFTLTLSDDYHRMFGYGEVLINLNYYHQDQLIHSEEILYNDFEDISINQLSAHFHTPVTADYLSISFLESENYFSVNKLTSVMLEEGNSFTSYEDFVYGSIVDSSSPEFQNINDIISFVHHPISVEEMMSSFIAIDKVDGDVSSHITVINDQYSANCSTLGTYPMTFSVTDAAGNETIATINVEVVDILKPVFMEQDVLVLPYPQTMSLDDIKSLLHASDNYDGDITSQIQLESDDYSAFAEEVGSYSITYSVSDSSGNTETQTIYIHVVDTEAPVFSGITEIVVGYDKMLSIESILSGLTVMDNYDSSIHVEIESNAYTSNADTIGYYDVVAYAVDSSGNQTKQTVRIQVVDEIGPILYYNYANIQTYQDYVLSLEDFLSLLTLSNEFGDLSGSSVEVIYDSYTDHATTPGVYQMRLRIHTENDITLQKEFTITVGEPIGFIYESIDSRENFFKNHQQIIIISSLSFLFILSNSLWLIHFKKK